MTIVAYHQPILPPSGVEYATILKLTPSTLTEASVPIASTSTAPYPSGRALYNVVVARTSHLRIFEVREEAVQVDVEKEKRRGGMRRGTEAVEGEVAMDGQGEGFVNIDSVKVILLLLLSAGIQPFFVHPVPSEPRKVVPKC
jgi:cleavage and polyadenylation specificity factor subunit 1